MTDFASLSPPRNQLVPFPGPAPVAPTPAHCCRCKRPQPHPGGWSHAFLGGKKGNRKAWRSISGGNIAKWLNAERGGKVTQADAAVLQEVAEVVKHGALVLPADATEVAEETAAVCHHSRKSDLLSGREGTNYARGVKNWTMDLNFVLDNMLSIKSSNFETFKMENLNTTNTNINRCMRWWNYRIVANLYCDVLLDAPCDVAGKQRAILLAS